MNYNEAVPQPLNPEAWLAAKQLTKIMGSAEVVAEIAIKHRNLRAERQKKIMEVAVQLRDLMKSTDDQVNKLREDGIKEIEKIEAEHDRIMQEIRDAQSELRKHEFSLNVEEGTYTLVAARDPSEITVEASTVVTSEDHEETRIKATVDALLAKYMRPGA
jgi:hypothetical protein